VAGRYRQYRYWSIFHDAYMARLSMWDAHGAEFFTVIPWDKGGKAFREARAQALEALGGAIEGGQPPGEYVMEEVADAE
jgi:hypothetical protein